jgi:amidase
MSDIAFRTASELAADLAAGRIGSLELLDHFIARIDEHDGKLNAVVVRDYDRAREAARAIDAARAKGEATGPLAGLPMTVKESHNIAGLKTTWGSTDFADNVANEDSVVVQRLKRAGAVIFGKTNVPYMLADWQSYNDIYGQTNNPHDLGRSPGGSSGGCAAAIAAGLTGLEIGSDIGGSIRNPAAFCGVYGLKPTWDIVPYVGHALLPTLSTPDITVTGPIARGIDDLEATLDIIAGPTAVMAEGWKLDLPHESRTSLSDFRVAMWMDSDIAPVDSAVGDR